MKKNNRGLSTVVTTLIIILLVLVAVGIIWGVVSNLIDKSSGTIEASAECFDLDLKATSVLNNTSPANISYDVTLKRSAAGTANDVYAKVVLSKSGVEGSILDFNEGLAPLESATLSFADVGVSLPDKAVVTAYYLDDAGAETLCTINTQLEF